MDPRKPKATPEGKTSKEDDKKKPVLTLDDLPAFDPSREQAPSRQTEEGDFVEDLHVDSSDDMD